MGLGGREAFAARCDTMAKLIYASNMSLDGWTDAALAAQSDLMRDFANSWQAADKFVYATTLAAVSTANTRLERRFDPDAVHDLKAASSRDLLVGGPNIAAQALVAGLVDEVALFVWPVVLGGRNPARQIDTRVDLELFDEQRFGSGVVHLRYRVPSGRSARDRPRADDRGGVLAQRRHGTGDAPLSARCGKEMFESLAIRTL